MDVSAAGFGFALQTQNAFWISMNVLAPVRTSFNLVECISYRWRASFWAHSLRGYGRQEK